MASLNHYESLLLQHDPDFLPEHAFEAEQDPSNTLLHLLKHGMYPKYDAQDVGHSHQLHVNVERVRVPEVLFQPNIIGLDQAGLVDNINDIVRVYDASRKQSIVKVSMKHVTYSLYLYFLTDWKFRMYSSLAALV
jgi:actin-related protein 5